MNLHFAPKPLTAKQRRALRELDRSSRHAIGASAVMDIAGVLDGVKPAALQLYDEVDSRLLRRIGLKTARIDTHRFAVSYQQSVASDLAAAFNDVTQKGFITKRGHRRIGALLGYPTTATEYFLKRLPTVDTKHELPMIRVRAAQYTIDEWFMQLVLSPDAYKEEVAQYVSPLKDATRRLTPHTYKVLWRQAFRDRAKKYLLALIGRTPRGDGFLVRFVD